MDGIWHDLLMGVAGGFIGWAICEGSTQYFNRKKQLTPGQASLILAALPYGFFTDMPEFKAAVEVLRKIAGLPKS